MMFFQVKDEERERERKIEDAIERIQSLSNQGQVNTVFSGVSPAPEYSLQRVKLANNCCFDNKYPHVPRSRLRSVIHSQHYSCDEHTATEE